MTQPTPGPVALAALAAPPAVERVARPAVERVAPPPPPPRRRAAPAPGADSSPQNPRTGSEPPAVRSDGRSPSSRDAIPTRAAYGGPVVINHPVRSGQVIYAQNNDLVVMAPVSAGAQVIADGHVHIYAPLRGRAVAGAQGLPGARLFIQKLEAELVAIAGVYMMAEEIPAQHRGRSVQVYLEDGHCRIAPL